MSEAEWVSVVEAARRLGVSEETVRRRIRAGRISAWRLGRAGRWRVDRRALPAEAPCPATC